MRVFVGMETSGVMRRAFQDRGHHVISCDLLPSQDGRDKPWQHLVYGGTGEDDSFVSGHIQGDVFATLILLASMGWAPDLAILHPTCTYLTNSAAWAFGDGPYHQQVKSGTLVGAARRAARESALSDVRLIMALPIGRKVIENPIGAISNAIRKPDQIIQPWQFGDDASKATCLWFCDRDGNAAPDMRLPIDPAKAHAGRLVEWPRGSGRMVRRWSNQTDSGQNRLTPSETRWKIRSDTFSGFAKALAAHIG